MRRLTRSTTALAVTAAVLVGLAPTAWTPAGAVQTTTFKLAASGARTRLSHPAGTGAVHDSIVVANLSARPLTIDLDVIGVTARPDGNFDLGASGQGLAGRVHLARTTLPLAPHQAQTVTVVVDTPDSLATADYAAVTAELSPSATTGIGVQTRLALLVEVTPSSHVAGAASSTGSDPGRVAAIVVAALLVLGGGVLLARRRRETLST